MAMSMPTGDDHEEVMCEMNTTPLIDVMLVLLIMLIITIPIQTHAVKLDMPKGGGASNEKPKVVQIDIDEKSAIFWAGEPVEDREDLEERISEAANEDPQPEIHLRPDKSAKYDAVARVMAATQRLGLSKIGLTGSEQFR
jgi:biopolymer transport protein ExbD